MVNDIKSAGRPVSGGPLFCGQQFFFRCLRTCFSSAQLIGLSFLIEPTAAISHNDHNCALPDSATTQLSEQVTVDAAIDGDTVILKDGRRVRIIGINTAELSKKSERALKAEAIQARDIITSLVEDADYLTLVPGDEPSDRYGRVLAHLLLPDGSSLASVLLAHGLAAATSVAPNTRCADHNFRIERAARSQKKGVWQYPDNPWFGGGVETNSIQGFHILSAHVDSISQKRKRWYIELTNDVRVYAKLELINETEAQKWIGKKVEIRGWFDRRDGRTSVNLHHRRNLALPQ